MRTVALKFDAEFARVGKARSHRQTEHADPARLIVVDEADRLKMGRLEMVRRIFDRRGTGLVILGMLGLERRLSRYAKLYSTLQRQRHARRRVCSLISGPAARRRRQPLGPE